MISFEESLHIVSTLQVKPVVEYINFENATGRILAEKVEADMDMPPFNKSAVDGFACRNEDVGKPLEIIETVAAGKMPKKQVVAGTCIRIMTGAPLPEGANRVLMVEDCDVLSNKVLYRGVSTFHNICFLGEDIRRGQLILEEGTLIEPQHIAVLAAMGKTSLQVYRKVSVAVMSTGDELVEPYQKPEASQIRNSNSWQLLAQIQKAGGSPKYYGIVPDTFEATVDYIKRAVSENDLVFLSGGVSAGEFDFVPKAMQQLGFTILFDSIAVQPGRPTTLAANENKYIIGLPGNPVSSFVQFHLLGQILMKRMMGCNAKPLIMKGILGKAISRKKAQRKSFYPVCTNANGEIIALEYHGSAHINSLTDSMGVVSMEIGVAEIEEGSLIDVRLF
ncbi:MAG: hypothetical protein CVU11_13065 [Bacteroidetes bacterium HGW-Bacteroidetes-6]|jgi:molybdopterin molybdotransferase|nr:MAG: hypothetical protein CVU11_13065 [Bacteroidetes bacterium HGW-Bacteroidetes-6]